MNCGSRRVCYLTVGRRRQEAGGRRQEAGGRRQEAGGIHADGRQGVARFFPCATLSIGAFMVRPGVFRKAGEVASFAAAAKHRAKTSDSGFYLPSAESPSAWGRVE